MVDADDVLADTLAHETPRPWIGRVLANVYRIEAKIGEGGMGTVYAARHVHLGKQYAVKVLVPAAASNATAIERLKQEAIAASSIEHDNIVDVISFDRDTDGAVFIVMELLRGENLATRLARGPMQRDEALSIAHQIASALGKAHEAGIVHRDLKPENIYLAKKGEAERVKILDFGISKVKIADSEQVNVTRTGQLVGTPLYMSPEQARGEPDIDHKVDIYALGVILYEMLTGSPPFAGRNHFELLWKHGNDPPEPPSHRNPSVPLAIEAVVLRALSKAKEERFETMEALSAALSSAAEATLSPGKHRENPSRASRRAFLTLLSIAFAALAVFGTRWLKVDETGPAEVGPAEVANTDTSSGETARPLSLPPDRPGTPDESPAEATPATEMAEISIESTPAGAEVSIGGRPWGRTPLVVSLPVGIETTLVFHREGFFDAREELLPSAGARVRVHLRRRTRGATTTSLPMKTEL